DAGARALAARSRGAARSARDLGQDDRLALDAVGAAAARDDEAIGAGRRAGAALALTLRVAELPGPGGRDVDRARREGDALAHLRRAAVAELERRGDVLPSTTVFLLES